MRLAKRSSRRTTRCRSYNLACTEALAGRKDDAMKHLRAAFAASPSDRLRATAREDSDLDPIRGEPGFQEIVEGGE